MPQCLDAPPRCRAGLDESDNMVSISSAAADSGSHHTSRALSWKREILLIGVVYGAYTLVRNQFGSARLTFGARSAAFRDALRVINIERDLRMFHELTVQRWFLDTPIIPFFNLYYGIAHFVVTIAVLVWLLVKRPTNFRRWRSALLITTVLGVVGYSAFPLMPPRLLNAGGPYGSGTVVATKAVDYPFTDTLSADPTAWSFDSGPVAQLSNQYAAMPSLHVAWSTWCALAIIACSKRRRLRWLAIAHPILTLLATVVTANHYFLDAIGGLTVLGLGYLGALGIERFSARSQARRIEQDADQGVEQGLAA
ncbi:MAG: hypothetical protein RLZZ623_1747 [Actinomycetota bacterium]|jgi:membrane-associated phospholipid phosphatase